jgi:hypothetical protein
MSKLDPAAIATVVNGLDRWFESMRVDWPIPGYGGPVVHWWNHCLTYQGAGLDWRYEGIIDGYLTLWKKTGNAVWLEKARLAGDDLVGGQRSDSHFTNSRFELNPGQGGTPHEVACDLALLLLARELRAIGRADADLYLEAARRNLEDFALGGLWDGPSATFRDGISGSTFVPNKAATFVEAVLLLRELTGLSGHLERYAIPTGDQILALQMRHPGDELDGAIAQNRLGGRIVESYFPIYIARCVPGLLQLAEASAEERFRDAALAAVTFLDRIREPDGGFPMVLYRNGRRNRFPRWIAGTGDVVRAFDLAHAAGAAVDASPTIQWILRGARADGRIATADGFDRLIPWISRRERATGEIGVVGWCDKAFRAFAPYADQNELTPFEPIERVQSVARRVPLPGVVR